MPQFSLLNLPISIFEFQWSREDEASLWGSFWSSHDHWNYELQVWVRMEKIQKAWKFGRLEDFTGHAAQMMIPATLLDTRYLENPSN